MGNNSQFARFLFECLLVFDIEQDISFGSLKMGFL